MKLHICHFALIASVAVFVRSASATSNGNDNPTGNSGDYNGSVTTAGSYDPYTGNAKRVVEEITVEGSVGQYPLKWSRTLNTRSNGKWFGDSGGWLHSYQWGLSMRNPGNIGGPDPYEGPDGLVSYPDGRRMVIDYVYGSGAWQPEDALYEVGGGHYDLGLRDGGIVRFRHPGGTNTGSKLRATEIVDPHGLVTTLTYDNLGRLTRVTEPAGRYLQITNHRYTWRTDFGEHYVDVIAKVEAFAWAGAPAHDEVSYSYTQVNAGSGVRFYNLKHAFYPDGSQSHYTYYSPEPGSVPLSRVPARVRSCDDVRYNGPMKRIEYEYMNPTLDGAIPHGQVRREKNLTTGQIISEITYPEPHTAPADWRIETRADGSTRTFQYAGYQSYDLAGYSDFKNQWSYTGYDLTDWPSTYRTITVDARGRHTWTDRELYADAVTRITYPGAPPPGESGPTYVEFGYNHAGPYYVTSRRDENGQTTYFDRLPYPSNRIWRTRFPDGGVDYAGYNEFGQVTVHTSTSGGTEHFWYDPRGLKRKSWPAATPSDLNPHDHPTLYFYYEDGPHTDRLYQVIDPRGHSTWYEYNLRGQVTKIWHHDWSFIEHSYNPDGTLAWTSNELGHTTSYGYDEYKRATSVTNALNQTATNSYAPWNGAGPLSHTTSNIYETISPMGKRVHYEYDANFRKTIFRQAPDTAYDAWTHYDYDAVGNVVWTRDPRQRVTTHGHDERNRKVWTTDALNQTTSWQYDRVGNVKSELRPNGQTVTYDEYDPMNRLKRKTVQRDPGVYDQTAMSYDPAGNLRTLTDPRGKVYTYGYDALNRKTSLRYPADAWGVQREENWTYDIAGNVYKFKNRDGQTAPGATQTFTYDHRNRQTYFEWSDGTQPQETAYDAASRVTWTRNHNGRVDYLYDNAGRVLRDMQTNYGNWLPCAVDYTYDADGNRATVAYPMGFGYSYAYTQRNQLERIYDTGAPWLVHAVHYDYDASGNRLARILPRNNTRTDYAQADPLNRISAVHHTFAVGGGDYGRFDYGFDVMSRRTHEQLDFAYGDAWTYDMNGQVKSERKNASFASGVPTGGSDFSTLDYDANGNRTSVVRNGVPTTYTATDANQYGSINGAGLGYDPNGNLTLHHNGWQYQYDAQNRLIWAHHAGTNTHVDYYYDPRNRQIARDINGVRTYNVWDGWNVVEERDGAFNLKHAYLHGASTDEMIARFGGGYQTIWYYHDGRGSVSQLADDGGNVIERYTYDLAGNVGILDRNHGGTVRSQSLYENRFFFTGRDYMKETGLYDYRNRFYHPQLGRFMQSDPIDFEGGDLNLFRYCANDPVNRTDPDGLTTRDFLWDNQRYFSGDSQFSAEALRGLQRFTEALKDLLRPDSNRTKQEKSGPRVAPSAIKRQAMSNHMRVVTWSDRKPRWVAHIGWKLTLLDKQGKETFGSGIMVNEDIKWIESKDFGEPERKNRGHETKGPGVADDPWDLPFLSPSGELKTRQTIFVGDRSATWDMTVKASTAGNPATLEGQYWAPFN